LVGEENAGSRPSRKYEGWYGVIPEDAEELALPRYWVPSDEVEERLRDWREPWLVAFRDVTNAVVERTAIFTVLPRVGVGHNAPIVFFDRANVIGVCCFIANGNSMVFDFLTRNKIGGTHLTFGILEQLPLLPEFSFSEADRAYIANRVLDLVHTAHDLDGFADVFELRKHKCGWEEAQRERLIAELDAYFAHLYELTREELRYILDPKDVFGEDFPSETFRVLKQYEIKGYGEYRTQRLVLEAYDELAKSDRFRDEMPKRVSSIQAPSTTVRATSHS
jgi:hypothetical protein